MDKNKNPSRKRKRRAPNKKKFKTFTNEWKKKLVISDKGSWYNQSTLWKDSDTEKRRKIILPEENIDFDEEEIDLDGNRNSYIIMDLSLLNNALSERACCKNCGNTLKVICKEHQESGLGKNLKLCCISDNCKDNEFTNTEKDGQYFKINRTSVLAFRTIGKGRSAAEKFLAVMNLGSPVSKPSWKNHSDVLLEIASEISKENMNEARKGV